MFFLALKHLFWRKRQTLLTLMGVGLGTMAFVTFSGMMTGFQQFIIDQLVNNDAHVRISTREEFVTEAALNSAFFPHVENVFWIVPPSGRRDEERIEHPAGWIERLLKDSRVLAFAPQATADVIFRRGAVSQAGRMVGSDVDKQIRVSNIRDFMVEGDYLSIGTSGQRLVMGDELMKQLGVRVGDSVQISAGRGKAIPFKIVGSFHFGILTIDRGTVFASLGDVQQVNGRPSEITDIAIRLTDVAMAHQVSDEWSALSQDKVQSWDQANANILSVFAVQNFIRYFIITSIMVVAAFGIYNILNILVNQKRKDIGILRSIGFDAHDIVILFLIQGMILGLMGGLIGMTLGFLVSKYLGTLQIKGMVDTMRINFSLSLYLSAMGLAFASSALSSILPAFAASRMRPIDVLRSGE